MKSEEKDGVHKANLADLSGVRLPPAKYIGRWLFHRAGGAGMDARLRKILLSWQFICHVEAFRAHSTDPQSQRQSLPVLDPGTDATQDRLCFCSVCSLSATLRVTQESQAQRCIQDATLHKIALCFRSVSSLPATLRVTRKSQAQRCIQDATLHKISPCLL